MVQVAKLPRSEKNVHANVLIDNVMVSMNSRADGLNVNVHGATHNLTLQRRHIENSGDDCMHWRVGHWHCRDEDHERDCCQLCGHGWHPQQLGL